MQTATEDDAIYRYMQDCDEFDLYFKDKYPETYEEVLSNTPSERALLAYTVGLNAWHAAKSEFGIFEA